MSELKSFETPDLGFAAYLKMIGLDLKGFGRDDKRYKFVFHGDLEKIEQAKVDFTNSESYKFDSQVRILKLMIKSKN